MSPTDETESAGDKPGEKARGRRSKRRPATIDLAATEVTADAAQAEEAEAGVAEAAAGTAGEAPPRAEAEAGPGKAAAETPAEEVAAPGAAPGKEPRRPILGRSVQPYLVVFVLGAIAGGLIGLGAYGGVVRLGLLPGTGGDVAPLEAKIDALKAGMESEIAALKARPTDGALQTLTGEVRQLTERLAAAEAALAGIPQDDLSQRFSALEDRLAALTARLAGAEAAAQAGRQEVRGLIEKMAASGDAEAASAAIAALTRRIDAVEAAAMAEVEGRIEAARTALRGEIEERSAALAKEVADLRADVAGLRQEVATSAGAAPAARAAAALAVAVAGLERAVNAGAPFARELSTVEALAGARDEIAALRVYADDGVARRDELAETFQAAASAAMSATAPPTAGLVERLIANARRIVRIRPTGEVAGETTGAILARAEAQLAAGDLAAAVAELASLEPEAQAATAAWLERARARLAAERLVAALDQRLLTDLPAGEGTGAQ